MSSIHAVNVGGNSFDITDSSNVAPIELTNFATRTYAKDRCFIMADGLLYRAMVEIQSGDPIVINGNAKRTTLDEIMAVMETDSDLIAPTEDGTTASTDYAIGKQIVRSGILYKVIAEIAEGDAFVVGNNIEIAGTLTSQIQTLINETATINNVLGAKNLLPNTATSQVINGITFTVNNNDGSVTANGTATADATLAINALTLPKGTYVLNGCPSGGAGTTYRMYALPSGMSPYYDNGNGVQFTVTDNTLVYYVRIVIVSGQTVSNLVFKPMLRPSSIVDDTYVPYAMTNRELTENAEIEVISLTANPNAGISLLSADAACRRCGKVMVISGSIRFSTVQSTWTTVAQQILPTCSGLNNLAVPGAIFKEADNGTAKDIAVRYRNGYLQMYGGTVGQIYGFSVVVVLV